MLVALVVGFEIVVFVVLLVQFFVTRRPRRTRRAILVVELRRAEAAGPLGGGLLAIAIAPTPAASAAAASTALLAIPGWRTLLVPPRLLGKPSRRQFPVCQFPVCQFIAQDRLDVQLLVAIEVEIALQLRRRRVFGASGPFRAALSFSATRRQRIAGLIAAAFAPSAATASAAATPGAAFALFAAALAAVGAGRTGLGIQVCGQCQIGSPIDVVVQHRTARLGFPAADFVATAHFVAAADFIAAAALFAAA